MSSIYSSFQVKLMLTMLEEIREDTSVKWPWDTIASRLGYANGGSAQTTWRTIRAKMKKDAAAGVKDEGEGVGTPKQSMTPRKCATPKKAVIPRKVTPRKRKAADSDSDGLGDDLGDDDDDDEQCRTPSPSPVRPKRIKTAPKKLDDKLDDDANASELAEERELQPVDDSDSSDWAPT